MKKLSVVVPVFNEAASIFEFVAALRAAIYAVEMNVELIFVDDGSRDGTLEILKNLREETWTILVVSLSRNFGKESAITAGLAKSSGDAVVVIDADLQDPPSVIPKMIEHWSNGSKVVLARRSDRSSDTFLKRHTAKAFYWLNNKIANPPLPSDVGDFRLIDRQVVLELLKLSESNRFMKGLFAWVGFASSTVYYVRDARLRGKTKFNFIKLVSLAFEGVSSFSTFPLKIFSLLGFIVSIAGFSYAVFLVCRVFIAGIDIPGYSSIMVAVLTLAGLQLLGIGLLGEYLGRTYIESKNRPIWVEDASYINGNPLS